MTRTMSRIGAVAALGLALAATALSESAEPAKDLKSKDVTVRLDAVETLRTKGGEDAEEILLKALKDKDWEVVENAAAALGEQGGKDALKALIGLALKGPTRRIRQAAARAAGRLDPVVAVEAWAKKAGSAKVGVNAFEALAIVGPSQRSEKAWKAVDKGLRSKEREMRAAAAGALGVYTPSSGASRLQTLMFDDDFAVAAAALDAVILNPDRAYMSALVGGAAALELKDVISRRVLAAVRAIVATHEPGTAASEVAQPILDAVNTGGSVQAGSRLARLVGILAQLPPQPGPPAEGEEEPDPIPPMIPAAVAIKALQPAIEHEEFPVRAAAAYALGQIATDEALARLTAMAKEDSSATVRMHALLAVLRNRTVLDGPTFQLAADRLSKDKDLLVREEAAVALGKPKVEGAVPVLEKALNDAVKSPQKGWALGTCAAVSLGKTRDPAALPILVKAAKDSKDWRIKASALVGLGHLQHPEAIPLLIQGLSSKSPVMRNVGYEFLRRMTAKELPPKAKRWTAWWEENKDSYIFEDRDEIARKAKKYGYAPTAVGVYEGLDVIVLQSRGDHIEKLLDKLTIEHRLTRGGQVPAAGLHPYGLFVSNCTGEMTSKDVAQLQWFVRAGGYLFCSCWALQRTAELVYPGIPGYKPVARKLPTTGQVLDNVISAQCPTDSPYLDGVFDGIVRPIYVLYGSFLIEVMDNERVEVLIDSPDCATRWGGGNLACWFNAGHGVILDSANHFDLQGFAHADGLKGAEGRMAYAMDHMGVDYQELRELKAKRVWDSRGASSKEARDYSAFRLITNFVRQKRKQDN